MTKMTTFLRLCVALATVVYATVTHAQTGVSDDRVSVPDGPGSVEGIGDNATVNDNMGLMAYGVPFELPRGFEGATPSLGLTYGSGYGNGIAGIGWTMSVPSIERLTLRGLPTYTANDEFVADGSTQLVRVSTSGSNAVYRERFEGSFIRYTWSGVGAAGYWRAEYPDGSVGYFGATANGVLVPTARLEGSSGQTFRYLLVERVDVFGHRIAYDYALIDGAPYLVKVGYAHGAGNVARYAATFSYSERDDVLSDCKPGFDERTTRRLVGVSITTNAEQIRRYALSYESVGTQSRLVSVASFGRNGTRYPVTFTFGYSRAISGVCVGEDCASPFVVHMGQLPTGSAIRTGNATLVDINGDALPDVLDTSAEGFHTFILNRLDGAGRSSFDPVVRRSTIGTRAGFAVNQATVQVLDVNGDGLADLVNAFRGDVLCNDGRGDWTTSGCDNDGDLGLTLGGGTPGGDPAGIRFLDVDGDRRVDVMQTLSTSAVSVRLNTGTGFTELAGAEPIGVVFDESRLLLSDMNGDGLLDPVHFFATGAVRYRKHLGRARFSDWIDMPGPTIPESQRAAVELQDLNADGLDDLVLVEPDAVSYALNRAGASFDTTFSRIARTAIASLPERDIDTTVVYADMNANGSLDVVWIQNDGAVDYLELFPVQPNLLSRIENALGMVQTIHYGTAVEQRRADGGAWTHTLPIPSNVVSRVDTWTTLTGDDDGVGLHEVTDYRYHEGFYAGDEREFRGFARVELVAGADGAGDGQEASRLVETFDLGVADDYRKGRLLVSEQLSGAGNAERALLETRATFGDCTLTDVPASGLRFPVRYVCEQSRTTIVKEGVPSAQWATTRTTTTYDGYGQATLTSNLGVMHMGPPEAATACAPCTRDAGSFGEACGPTCTGDERFSEAQYISPGVDTGGRWILGRAHTTRTYGVASGVTSETRTHYDGPGFVGLALGRLSNGAVTRVSERREAGTDAMIDTTRVTRDIHGNVVAELDPLGAPNEDGGHRRSYVYDPTGLRITRTDVHTSTPEGVPYRLRREYAYDLAFDRVTEATGWMIIEGGTNRSARNQASIRYDEFGRRVAIIRPGDSEAAPTVEYAWHLGDPATRIVERRRSVRGAPPDLERVLCIDGRGRTYQERTRIEASRYQISGFIEFNSRGAAVRTYQPYVRSGGFCETSPPSNVLYEDIHYDALAREIRRTYPDADTQGSSSSTATTYAPLSSAHFDQEDLDPESPNANTPTIVHHDGLGRTVAVERRLTADDPGAFTRAAYDALGRLTTLTDPLGNAKTQTHDLLGRLLVIDDPSSGETRLSYDDVGNIIGRTDARGVVTRMSYDGANRTRSQWNEADPSTEVRIRYDFDDDCADDCTHAGGQAIEVSYPVDPDVVARIGGAVRGTDHFGFDARGQSTYGARTVAGLTLVTRHVFDNAGRLVSTIHPDGRSTDRTYDGASRPVGIDEVMDEIAYDERGTPSRLDYANGASETWAFDSSTRLSRRTLTNALGTGIEDVSYEHDRFGNITGLSDAAPAVASWRPLDARFTYDAWYRMVGAEYSSANDAAEIQTRTYDLIDNARSITSSAASRSATHVGELTYDEARPNAIVSADGTTYQYDDAGYMVEKGDLELAWDHLGRLTRASRNGESVAQFSYAAGMSRVARIEGNAVTLYASEDYELRDGIGVLYVRLGRQRVARRESDALATELLGDPAPRGHGDGELNAADAWIAHSESGDAADPGTLLRSAGRRLLAEAGDGHVALHSDHLGSLVAATDERGDERGRSRFVLPTGEDRESGFVDAYGLSGQEMIVSIGLLQFEHRWLEPRTLRWTRPDPAFEQTNALHAAGLNEATNRFAFVGNNIINNVDPQGLTAMTAAVALHGNTVNLAAEATAMGRRALNARGARVLSTPTAALRELRNYPANASVLLRQDMATNGTVATQIGTQDPNTNHANQAHHVVPGSRRFHPLMNLAAQGGFNINGAENGVLAGTSIHRFFHPRYSAFVGAALDALHVDLAVEANGNAIDPIRAAQAVSHLTNELHLMMVAFDRAFPGDTLPAPTTPHDDRGDRPFTYAILPNLARAQQRRGLRLRLRKLRRRRFAQSRTRALTDSHGREA